MKLKTTSKFAAAVLAVALTSAANALPSINGVINFAGSATLDSGTFANTTRVLSWSGAALGGKPGAADPLTGDFAAIPLNAPVTFAAPWVFSNPQVALWSVGGFTFDIGAATKSVATIGTNSFLNVAGTGTIKKAGFADTTGTFSFSTQKTTGAGGSRFSFSANGDAIPDSGTSVVLLGTSLLGLAGIRRKLSKH